MKKFERLTREGDVVQRELSKLQSANAGINTTSEAYDEQLGKLRTRMAFLLSHDVPHTPLPRSIRVHATGP